MQKPFLAILFNLFILFDFFGCWFVFYFLLSYVKSQVFIYLSCYYEWVFLEIKHKPKLKEQQKQDMQFEGKTEKTLLIFFQSCFWTPSRGGETIRLDIHHRLPGHPNRRGNAAQGGLVAYLMDWSIRINASIISLK